MARGLSNRLPIPDDMNTRVVLGEFIRRTLCNYFLEPPQGYTKREWARTVKVLERIEKALELTST